eukprot:tig00001467_g8770.t1
MSVDDDERRGDPDPRLLHRRGEEQGVDELLDGTIQNDILKEFMVQELPSPSPTAGICEYGVASGLDIDKFAGRLSFFFASA